jgi:hypothetical protein
MSINKQLPFPEVFFFNNKEFNISDPRRIINGVAGDFGPSLKIKQIKLIHFSKKSLKDREITGNHKHYSDSGQWEIIIVFGESVNPQFDFRYRNYNDPVSKKKLFSGDVVLVPPGCSLGLIPLELGALVIEISNCEYNSKNYIKDDLFNEK